MNAWWIAWKDLKIQFRDLAAVLLLFLVPMIVITIASFALGGLFEEGAASVKVPFIDADDSPASRQVVAELEKIDGLLIESGDRAHPNETSVDNYLFYIKDREVVSGSDAVRAENSSGNPPGRYQFDDLADQSGCVTGAEVVSVGDQSINCSDLPLPNG